MLIGDVNMLFSYINTGLRDKYEDLEDMAASEGFDAQEVRKKLEECKKISDEKQAAKTLAKELEKIAPPKKPDVR